MCMLRFVIGLTKPHIMKPGMTVQCINFSFPFFGFQCHRKGHHHQLQLKVGARRVFRFLFAHTYQFL